MSATSAVNDGAASTTDRRRHTPEHSPSEHGQVVVPVTATANPHDAGRAADEASPSESATAAVLGALAAPTALLSHDAVLVTCNPPLLSLTDWGDFLGTPIVERIEPEDRPRFIDTFRRAGTATADGTQSTVQTRVRLLGDRVRHAIIHVGAPIADGYVCQIEPIDDLLAIRAIIAELTSDRDPAGPISTVLHALARPPIALAAAVVRSDRHSDELVAAPSSAVGELARELFTSLPWSAATSAPVAFAAGALPPDAAARMLAAGYQTYIQVMAFTDDAPGRSGDCYRLIAFSTTTPAHCAPAIERVGIAGDLVALVLHRVEQARKLTHAATHDTLTKVANRHGLEVEASRRPDSIGGVIYVDLDRLKPVNDRFGHRVGDAVLRAVAGRLQRATRPTDLVARIGGDEFVDRARPVTGCGPAGCGPAGSRDGGPDRRPDRQRPVRSDRSRRPAGAGVGEHRCGGAGSGARARPPAEHRRTDRLCRHGDVRRQAGRWGDTPLRHVSGPVVGRRMAPGSRDQPRRVNPR